VAHEAAEALDVSRIDLGDRGGMGAGTFESGFGAVPLGLEPGRPAPLLIDDETFAGLTPGTVIVDLAAETGGNTSRTEPGETVTAGGVKIVGSVNLPSQMAADASRFFSGNIRALLEHLIPDETGLRLRLDDPITAALLGVDQTLRTAA
jgi:NAD(P) transhydrogenase subunit alpha